MFIPNKPKFGDKYRLKRNVSITSGTFTAGHEFKVIGSGERGLDFEDVDGNRLLETGLISDAFERIKE